MVEHLGPAGDDALDRAWLAEKIGRQHLDRRAGPLADRQHAAMKMLGAAVRQIIARDRSDDDVRQTQPGGRFGHALGLVLFDLLRLPLGDGAEAARPGADIAQDHERGRLLRVALHAVGAFGVVANRLQAQLLKQAGREVVGVPLGNVALQPAGQTRRERFGAGRGSVRIGRLTSAGGCAIADAGRRQQCVPRVKMITRTIEGRGQVPHEASRTLDILTGCCRSIANELMAARRDASVCTTESSRRAGDTLT